MTFKNSKTKKTTSKKYRCVVKAEKKPVEEAYKINSATATGVKTITVELNKAVADATKITKVDVKKGTAARESKFTVDGSKIVIAMDAKLTAGAYNVTIEGLEATALTADVTVEKDETLTSFEIADYIVAESNKATTNGIIRYAALNQYGEKMVSSEPTVTCSFGQATVDKAATATAEGKIKVTNIPSMLAIVGTKGTVVLVSNDTGISATKEISYNVAATPSTVEIAGTYHKNSATLKSIVEGDTISDYELLLTAKDQYGYDVSAEDFKDVTATLAGGLTNLNIQMVNDKPKYDLRTLNGVDYIAVSLTGATSTGEIKKAQAGDATLSMVNPYKGLLITTTISVAKNVVLKSLNITADNGVYENQDNVLTYEAIDAEGKSVTGYAELSSLLNLEQTNKKVRLEKNADGTAKMIYNPGKGIVPVQTTTDKASIPQVITITANSVIGGDYLVKTFSFTVYQERFAKGVIGVAADQATSISSKGKALEIPSTKIVLADQYSNKLVDGDAAFNKKIFDTTAPQGTSGTAIYVATNGVVTSEITADNKIKLTPSQVGTATVYLKYSNGDKDVVASTTNYDARFTVSVFDTANVDTTTLEIKSINEGFTVHSTNDEDPLTDTTKITVVAKVGGTETIIPSSQYVIVKNENWKFTSDDAAKNIDTKTAKVTIQVTTWDSNNNDISTQISKEYQVSKADPKVYKVTKANKPEDMTVAKNTTMGAVNFKGNFEFKDQYNNEMNAPTDAEAKSVAYKIELISATDKTGYTISANNLNSAQIEFTEKGTYVLKITATTPDGSSKDYQFTVTVN